MIDFIRTHHGTSVYIIFTKNNESWIRRTNEKIFSIQDPRPFSKETAILMMADAV